MRVTKGKGTYLSIRYWRIHYKRQINWTFDTYIVVLLLRTDKWVRLHKDRFYIDFVEYGFLLVWWLTKQYLKSLSAWIIVVRVGQMGGSGRLPIQTPIRSNPWMLDRDPLSSIFVMVSTVCGFWIIRFFGNIYMQTII